MSQTSIVHIPHHKLRLFWLVSSHFETLFCSDLFTKRIDYIYTESSTQGFQSAYGNGSQTHSSEIIFLIKDIRFYSLGIIIPLGLLGNFVSTFVFLTSQLRRKTAGQYFVALAIADNIVLIGELCLWINIGAYEGRRIGVDFISVNDATCQVIHYIRYLGRIWSSLIVMTISIDRLAMIISPFTTERYSTPKTARIIILLLLVFSASVSSPIFVYAKIRAYREKLFCYIVEEHYDDFLHWCLAGVVTFEMIVPGIVISIMTGLIIYKLAAVNARRRTMQASRTVTVRRSERQTNVTLIAVALAFLLLRPPYVVSFCLHLKIVLSDGNPCDHGACGVFIAYGISYALAILNYSLNFLLYFATGSSFRKELYYSINCQPTGISCTSSSRQSMTRSLSCDSQSPRFAHWGRVTHICIGKLTIGSDNGLSPGRSRAIIWNNVGNSVNWTLRSKLQWNCNRNINIFIKENAFESVVCEMSQCWSRCRLWNA